MTTSNTKGRPLLAFFGHHKCASSWIEHICGEVCRELKLRFKIVYTADMFDHDLPRYVREKRIDFLAYANADYRYVRELPEVRGFHVVRDPRDVCVSAYFSHLHSHPTTNWPELEDHRQRLQAASREEGLLLEMEFRRQQFEEMRSWPREIDGILELKMEELTTDPYQGFLGVFSFLGLLDEGDFGPGKRIRFLTSKGMRRIEYLSGRRLSIPYRLTRLPPERLLGIVWDHDFRKKSGGRKPGQEDPRNHYRKGVAGDWKNYFRSEHLRYFQEHYEDLLWRYEYDADLVTS